MSSDPATEGTGRTIRIGKYEVVAHIASGGMGAVYRAYDPENDREVALKVMTPEMAAKPAMLERFRREARSGLKLQHENVVTLYEFAEANGTWFLAMEFVEGIDLHEYIDQRGVLDPEESRQIVIQAARALNHAHKQGIVHRDIKPSNFLLTQRNGELRVKLTDLGLARETSNEEFRVTRSGTTVGTVDYISPEQARDSGLADIRSDLYSLGCSWYHMLAGQTPFAEGGLAERLLKHMTTDPPDVRGFNPRVSDDLVRVLTKLLAKKPEDRYQNPQELIQDLVTIDPIARPQAKKNVANGEPEPSKSKITRRNGSGTRRAASGSKKKSGRANRAVRRKRIWVVTGLAAAALAAGLMLWLGLRGKGRVSNDNNIAIVEPPRRDEQPSHNPCPTAPHSPTMKTVEKSNPIPAAKSKYAPLYKSAQVVNAQRKRDEYEKPWANQLPPPNDAKVLHVSRAPGKAGAPNFPSLAAAFKAAEAGKTSIIEINDNGPLFEMPASAADRSLVVRAGTGFRPLLVWDMQKSDEELKKPGTQAEEGRLLALFEVQRGSLTLEGMDVVVKMPERHRGRGILLQVTDGDLTAKECTFSVEGKKSQDAVAVARLTGSKADGGRCRLTDCYGRGTPLVALDLNLLGSEALLDNCLFVGGDAALVQARVVNTKPITVRTIRSTLVCGQSLVTIQPAASEDRAPLFNWMGWDSLYARSNRHSSSDMVVVANNAGTQHLRWDATNCLYVGWPTLLRDERDVYGPGQIDKWRVRWKRAEGDEARAEPWPAAALSDLAETPATFFRTTGSSVAFAASTDPYQLLGCQLDRLPPVRESWLGLTYDRFDAPLETSGGAGPPEVPVAAGDLYQGERLDLNLYEDLGKYLERLKDTRKFAPRVVLQIFGSGQKKTSPFVVPKGTSLVLSFQPLGENRRPISLVGTTSSGPALFETEEGSLDLIGADLRVPDQSGNLTNLLKVQGGDLRLQRCRLVGALSDKSTAFESLIDLKGSGSSAADKARGLVVDECTLVSGRDAIHVEGIGARVKVGQSVLVAGGDAFRFSLDKAYQGRANVQCFLSYSTLAAREAVVHLCDVQDAPLSVEPLVVQTKNCAFMSPFKDAKSGILVYEGEALERGLILWQGDGDGFHNKLHFRMAQSGTSPAKQGHAEWTSLWGSPGDRRSLLDLHLARGFDSSRWDSQLNRLVFQPLRPGLGADLGQLGLTKKMP